MSIPDYIFLSPLLGPDDAWAGYRTQTAPGQSPGASLSALTAAPQLAEFDRRHPWFIGAGSDCAANDFAGGQFIPVFPCAPSGDTDASLQPLEAELRQRNRKLGLITTPEAKLPGAGAWDYLLISASHARSLPPYTLLGLASRTTVIATEVLTRGDRTWALANACTLSSNEFLLARPGDTGKADITRMKLLKLLGLIENDANTGDLEAIFREEPKLSYSLLRLVNSASLAPRSPISSFGQAINLLGRRQLQRWLQLLVYSDPNNGQHANPLLQAAATRGRLLELLVTELPGATRSESEGDTAFMIGAFSLLDVLLNMAMPDVLKQLPLPSAAQQALALRDGPQGELLAAIEAADKQDLPTAARLLEGLGISSAAHLAAQMTALDWAAKLRPAT